MLNKLFFSMLLIVVPFTQTTALPGDINEDATIDILDIMLQVNFIIGNTVPTEDQLWAADMNADGTIEILDIIQLVNVIVNPIDCGDAFICPDNPYECCTPLHSESFINCAMCHSNNYNQTENPIHSQQVYPTDYCNLCHNPVLGWQQPNWSHIYAENSCSSCHQPNLGHMQAMGHSESNCLQCHVPAGLPTLPECMNCHIDDYQSTSDPDHSAMNLSQDCSMCHQTTGWEGADPHSLVGFVCSDCHNFNGIGNPMPEIDHNSAVKLGEDIYDCEMCHTSTTQWTSVSFSSNRHDGSIYNIYFNIYSGDHSGEWGNSCSDNCHVFGEFNTFSCWDNCHANIHNHSNIEDEHCNNSGNCADCSGWNGYWNIGNIEFEDGSWSDPNTFQQCYMCHPNGSANGPCGDD